MGTPIAQEGTASNRYTILGRLAGGGMADIFLARATSDAGVERHVVLKRVLAERSRDPVFAKMFLDEARLAAQLQHPNIAQVHDVGMIAGSYFFTMEYVHGEDVRGLLQALSVHRRPLPINHVLHIAVGALAALHYAHARTGSDGQPLGVVHRDVSPSNLMLSYDGAVKLLDFGVAKASQHTHESRAGTIKGKIAYLSPEQCHGRPVDRRSDIFSLGIVLTEMLTGKRMYKRESDFSTMNAIVNEEIRPPSILRSEISPEIDRIVLRALEKTPDRRYSSAGEMLEELEGAAAAERHVLSATAMGRFMREVFGERPEPWIELRTRERDTQSVTVTSESVAGVEVEAAEASLSGPDHASAAQSSIEAQLEQAPEIGRRTRATDTPAITADVMPPAVTAVATQPFAPAAPQPYAQPPSGQPYPRAYSQPSVSGDPAPRRSRRPLIITGVAVGVIGIGAAILFGMGSRDAPGEAPADATVIATAPPIDAPEPAVEVKIADAAPVIADAAVAPIAVDAAVVAAPPPSIAELAANAEWPRVARLCAMAKLKQLSADDRASCGTAACNARQRSTALTYHRGATKAVQSRIERACSLFDISLVAPIRPPPKDPCEANPLKCQK